MGLALFATLLSRSGVLSRAALASHVTLLRPEVASRVSAMTTAMGARTGGDASRGGEIVGRVLDGLVRQQAMVLGFERVFLVAGVAFLAVLPLLIFLKSPDRAGGGPAPKIEVHIDA